MHIGVVAEVNSFHTEKWVLGLVEAGVDVTVFSLSEGAIPGVRSVHVPPRFASRNGLRYLSYLGSGDRLRAALEAHQVDLINPINITPHGVWARWANVRPTVMVAMGADILEYPPERNQGIGAARSWESNQVEASGWARTRYAIKWYAFRHEVDRALKSASLVTGDNLQLVQSMQRWFQVPAEKTYLHRWGIDEALFQRDEDLIQSLRMRMGIKPHQRVLLSPRGLKPIYQGDMVLSAFEQLLAGPMPDVKLIALSTGYEVPVDLADKAFQLMARYPAFHFQADRLSRQEVAQLWHLTDAFVNIPVYDGFSNALCEGRYIGAIPIVQDIPAHREVLEPDVHACFVDPLTPENLCAGIRRVWALPQEVRIAMQQANREWIMRHAHLATNMQHFLKHCEQLLTVTGSFMQK